MKKQLLLAFSFILSISVVVAAPVLPHSFYGDISFHNGDAPQQGEVTARVNGQLAGSIAIEDGQYGDAKGDKLFVQGFSGGDGDKIKFYVNGMEAEETFKFEEGAVDELDLNVTVPPENEPTEVSQVSENVTPDKGVDVEVPEAASKEDSGAESVNISVNDSVGDVEVNITVSVDPTNESGDTPEGTTVHGYIDVNTNIDNSDISETNIQFKVSEDALKGVGAEPENVVLLHYEDGTLVDTLDATYLEGKSNRDGTYHHFRATASGFSSFGMGSDTEDPEADIQASSTDVTTEDTVNFDGSGSTDNTGIDSYSWDFGDGGSATGETVSHSYSETGDFTVTLTVEDGAGNSDSATETVSVSSPAGSEVTQQETQQQTNETEQPPEEEQEVEEQQNETEPEEEQEVQQFGNETGPQEPEGPTGPTGLVGAVSSNAAPVAAVLLLLLIAALHYFGVFDIRETVDRVRRTQESEGYSYRER